MWSHGGVEAAGCGSETCSQFVGGVGNVESKSQPNEQHFLSRQPLLACGVYIVLQFGEKKKRSLEAFFRSPGGKYCRSKWVGGDTVRLVFPV